MTKFPLSPGWVDIRYDDSHRTHHQKLQVDPSGVITPGVEPLLATRSGGPTLMSTLVAAYAAVMKTQFAAASEVVLAEFWSQPLPTDDPVWIFAVPINLAGTGGGTEEFTRQVSRSFRSGAGHLLRIEYLGVSSIFVNDQNTPLTGADPIATYLASAGNFILARDNSFTVAPLNYQTKTNDKMRKLEIGL
jgi:hypothetical protein